MDSSFTENILERARERQKKLAPLKEANVSSSAPNVSESPMAIKPRKEVVSDSALLSPKLTKQNSKTRIYSTVVKSPLTEFNTLNIERENINMEIKFSSSENVRVEVEITDDDSENNENVEAADKPAIEEGKGVSSACVTSMVPSTETPLLREQTKHRLDRLGKLYSEPQIVSKSVSSKPDGPDNSKRLKWDKNVIENLEKPPKTESQKPLKEIAAKKFELPVTKKEENLVTPRSPMKNKGAVASRAALFERNAQSSPTKPKKDPALLSVSQRKALFEKNAGEALIPKAAFGMAVPISKAQPAVPNAAASSSTQNAPIDKSEDNVKKVGSGKIADKIALLSQGATSSTISQKQIEEKVKEERKKEMDVLLNRFNQNKEINRDNSESEDEEGDVSETTAMINSKRSAKVIRKSSDLPPPPPPPTDTRKSGEKRPKSGDSPQVQAVLGDLKRVKVTQPKEGKLYPNLSDIEATTETEATTSGNNSSTQEDSNCESDADANTSFGRDILSAVCANEAAESKYRRVSTGSTSSAISEALADMSDYLNKVDAESVGPTPPKLGKMGSPQKCPSRPSQSFVYKKQYSPRKSPSKFRSPCKIVTSPRRDSNLPSYVVDGSDVLPLTHTVSFYRKQQTQGSTPVRQIVRHPIEEQDEMLEVEDDEKKVERKIESLEEEVNKQQMIISQTSRALNLCNSTPEFTGSTEQVEAEKLLLVSSHRRQAVLQEIQRLKVEKTLRPLNNFAEDLPINKGTITISNITLPLKKEYVKALAAAGGKGHHVVCLVKCGEHVASTQLVSTVASSAKNFDQELKIPGCVKLNNVYTDFTITMEVYCLQAQEEILPHEVKYHINKKGSKLTPRKYKPDNNKLLRPPKESPAGPQAVRSSSFALNGYIIFSIQAINKTQWTLNQIPPISPLEGSVNMRVHCELDVNIEHRGFLNMFEDVSGLGAWHRRWCLLKGHLISYWKYPEDERKKAPIDTINLKTCFTINVGPVSREICARPHTFLLERKREAHANDKDTLTVTCNGDTTIIKHLLSADTKEERMEWCANLNNTLVALRMTSA